MKIWSCFEGNYNKCCVREGLGDQLADFGPIIFYPKSILHFVTKLCKILKTLDGWILQNICVKCSKCVPSVLVTINCANKMLTFQNNKRVRIIKITQGGAGGAILKNYENMLTSPKPNLFE